MSDALFSSDETHSTTSAKLLNSKIKHLSHRSNLRGALAIARDIGAIAIIIAINIRYDNIFLYLASIWAIGAIQFAMSEALLHEASHYNLFRRRSLNDLSEIIVGLPFFQTVRSFRAEHKLHHAYLLQDRDTLGQEYTSYGLYKEGANWFWLWFVKPVVGYSAIMLMRGGQGMAGSRDWLKIGGFWAAIGIASYWLGAMDEILFYWLVPLVFCKGAFLYWSEVADHFRTRSGHRTRIGSVANFIFHNNGYHHAHHRYPGVTMANLRQAHDLTVRDGDDISRSFIDTYRQIRAEKAAKREAPAMHYTLTAEA